MVAVRGAAARARRRAAPQPRCSGRWAPSVAHWFEPPAPTRDGSSVAVLELSRALAARSARPVLAGTRPRILLSTEGTYPYVHGRRELVVRPAGQRARRVRLARAADRRSRQARAALHAAAAGARGRAASRSGRRTLPRGAAPSEDRDRSARRARPPSDRVGGRHRRRCWTRSSPAGATPRTCAARSARGSGWSAYLSALGDGARRARSRRPGTPPRLDLVEAAALYQTLYWVARTAAEPTPASRPAARHRGGLVGDPGASSTRRCTARRWCSPSTASTCASPTSPPCAAATRPGTRFADTRLARGLDALGLRRRRRDLPRDRRQRLLGDGPRHRPREDPGALQRPRPAGRADRRRPARRRSCRSGASTRSRTSTRCCASRPRRCG